MDQGGRAAIEARLERYAERVGDPTAPAIAAFYRRYPEGRASFVHHSPHATPQLEAEMVGNVLYYMMNWFENPIEARIAFDSSVPHHRIALDVPPDWYRGFIEVVIDEVEGAEPAASPEEEKAWREMREGLVGLVERNRFV